MASSHGAQHDERHTADGDSQGSRHLLVNVGLGTVVAAVVAAVGTIICTKL